jgi:alkylation response protein AidB-like acyl-CoA dehydrogenase
MPPTPELILEGVQVPKANLLGERNQGFQDTKRVLECGLKSVPYPA